MPGPDDHGGVARQRQLRDVRSHFRAGNGVVRQGLERVTGGPVALDRAAVIRIGLWLTWPAVLPGEWVRRRDPWQVWSLGARGSPRSSAARNAGSDVAGIALWAFLAVVIVVITGLGEPGPNWALRLWGFALAATA
ncbi:hypothetical protein ABZ478_05335 [Streptomyces sp. NPDC005706]|uniref:hypothetical protein n=1 Tax=Streptomyces sp. NPDC005706 TaxID=3157169 RepID=UPI00340ADEB0